MTAQGTGSLDRRLALRLAGLALAGLTAVCVGVWGLTALRFGMRQQETLDQKRVQVMHLLEETGGADGAVMAHALDDALVGRPDLGLSVRDAQGAPRYRRGPGPTAGATRQDDFESRGPAGTLHATLSLSVVDDRRLLEALAHTLALAALAGAVVIGLGGWWLVRQGLRPVRELAEQIGMLGADALHRRLDGRGQPAELWPLVEHTNALLDRLDRACVQLEAFNADVAHELFTPLASLIGSTEVALRRPRRAEDLQDLLGSHLEDLRRISLIVQDMAFLSQAERGAQARRERVDSLAGLARAVADLHEAFADEAGVLLAVQGDAAAAVDARLLQRALANLLGNALRHAERGSTVRVVIAAVGPEAVLTVHNHGPRIDPVHLPRLFDRFFRGDPARADSAQHHGLGLAIVAAIARMHGGRTVARSQDGWAEVGFTVPGLPAVRP